MGTRRRVRRARPATLAVLLLAVLTAGTAAAGPGAGHRRGTRRTVRVMVLADPALRKDETWKVDIFRAVNGASLALEAFSGLSLRIKAYGYWAPPDREAEGTGERRPETVLSALASLNRRLREAGRGPGELVIGLVPEGPEGPSHPGVADYLMGTVIIKYLKSRSGIPYVLLHEVLHIFGAIDLGTPDSVMSRKDPSFRIDGFTQAIVGINRDRSFLTGEFPLSVDRVAQAIDLYGSRRALDLGEEELAVCLNFLNAAQGRVGNAQAQALR